MKLLPFSVMQKEGPPNWEVLSKIIGSEDPVETLAVYFYNIEVIKIVQFIVIDDRIGNYKNVRLYYLFAKEFGWTPEEVDNAPAAVVVGMLKYHNHLHGQQNWNGLVK